MAVKSVIDIEINDSAFKRFASAWTTFRKVADKPLASLSKDVAVLKSQTEIMNAQAMFLRAQRKLELEKEESLGRQLSLWNQIATRTRDFSDRLRNVQTLLTRMGVGTAIAGVLGAGSLWGLDRLAGTVGAGRRGAQGLGVSYGEARAFRLNFERLVDAPSFLSGVAGALASPGGAVPFGALGLNQAAEQKKGAAQAGVDVLRALKNIADTKPETLWSSILATSHLDQFNVGTEELRRLRATSPTEFASITGHYGKDIRTLGLSDQTAKVFQDFYIQMDRAGGAIEAVVALGLKPLLPALTDLSASVVKAIGTLLGPSDQIKADLEKLGHGIEWFAGYVGSDDFQTKIKNFVVGIGQLADTTVSALRWLGVISTPKSETDSYDALPDFFSRDPTARRSSLLMSPGAATAASAAWVTGLNTELAYKLHALRKAAERDIGEFGTMTSGFRSYEDQARLYANRGSNPYPVARPGFSEHEKGLAADVTGSRRFMDYVHAHAAEYGLNFPHANDPVHVQLANPRVDIRIDNPAGANVFTTTNAVGGAP